MLRAITLAALLTALATAAPAQTYYNGWNTGPDYNAMLQEALRQQEAQRQQQNQGLAEIIRRTMQDPRCQALYQQHLAQGGRLSFEQFAYQYAATGGFTPDGIARYRATEADNMARERAAVDGLRQAERGRGAAQSGLAEGYFRNQQEGGNVLQGRGTYLDPLTGQPMVLPTLRPGEPTRDPNTGRLYVMDNTGTYHVQGNDGLWYRMAPAR